eukprot:365157-Chlamydomonas_euryale.AAC.16
MGTHADQLYAMDVRYLDPRRPRTKKLTSEVRGGGSGEAAAGIRWFHPGRDIRMGITDGWVGVSVWEAGHF